MTLLRRFFLIAGIIGLTACSIVNDLDEINALNQAQPVGSPFTQALSLEYRAMANKELHDMIDYPDALHFARKGLAAVAGDAVMPEPVSDWNLSETDIGELHAARGRLVVAYDLGAREVAPELSAFAQSRYDCWIEDQEEMWDEDNIPCKAEYLEAINKLESMVQDRIPAAPPPAPEPMPIDTSKPMKQEDAIYLVFFNWDKSDLTVGATSVIDAVAAEAQKFPPNGIVIVGHADTSGAKTYNQGLSLKRANQVRQGLIARGIDPTIISTDARGESELMVETADNVREPANRRATITFQ